MPNSMLSNAINIMGALVIYHLIHGLT